MMSSSDTGNGADPSSSPLSALSTQYTKLHRSYQQILDRWTPHTLNRWLATAGLLVVFFVRIVLAQGVRFMLFFPNIYG